MVMPNLSIPVENAMVTRATACVPIFTMLTFGLTDASHTMDAGDTNVVKATSLAIGAGSSAPGETNKLARRGEFSITATMRDIWPCVNRFMHTSFV